MVAGLRERRARVSGELEEEEGERGALNLGEREETVWCFQPKRRRKNKVPAVHASGRKKILKNLRVIMTLNNPKKLSGLCKFKTVAIPVLAVNCSVT